MGGLEGGRGGVMVHGQAVVTEAAKRSIEGTRKKLCVGEWHTAHYSQLIGDNYRHSLSALFRSSDLSP